LHDFRRERIDPRYAAIKALLPRSGEVGYVSDERVATGPVGIDASSPGTRSSSRRNTRWRRWCFATTTIVRPGRGESRRPGEAAGNPRARRLIVIAEAGPGIAVLRPQ